MTNNETKRLHVNTSVNIRSAEKLGLVDKETLPIDQTCKESAEILTDDNEGEQHMTMMEQAIKDWFASMEED